MVIGTEPESEAIAMIAWKEMEVNVEYLLVCCFTIGKEEVDPFAVQPAGTHGGDQLMGHPHQVGGGIGVKIGQICGMEIWDNQQVSGIDRLEIHECRAPFVAVDETAGRLTGKNIAENAVHDDKVTPQSGETGSTQEIKNSVAVSDG
jgi:hypothetical protein